jgi:CobQ-like glutamine amidotransferase family enzyme
MNERTITLLQLYPRDMNIYGDWGNTLVLKRRLEWHGYTVKLLEYNVGDAFPSDVDIIVGGGGQDSGQSVIHKDLLSIGSKLHDLANKDVPMLVVCGLYQLFGTFFKMQDGQTLEGISLLDIETHAGPERLTGNIITSSPEFGDIIGYENHSGRTFLGKDMLPFGKVIKGAGNNGQDDSEGARYRHVIGTYLHGSLLPKNPLVADSIIEHATTQKYGDFTPTVIDDHFTSLARQVAGKRPR